MKIQERAKDSNNETIVVDKELVSIKEHLTFNKILIGKQKGSEGVSGGFFKIINGTLQLHTFKTVQSKKVWESYLVLDADEEEKARNKKLNVLEPTK